MINNELKSATDFLFKHIPGIPSYSLYSQVVEIDLRTLEPHVNGPFTPGLATPISQLSDAAKKNRWTLEVKDGLIGSCTNSSYKDMSRVASLMKQALAKGLKS